MCQKCDAAVPLSLLTEHIKSCDVMYVGSDENQANADSESEDRKCKNSSIKAFAIILHSIKHALFFFTLTLDLFLTSHSTADMQECPVCTQMFPFALTEGHASSCVER